MQTMNWGYKILIAYLVFVAGIVYLVFRSSSEKIDLVTKDYYAEEIQYQKKIDETKRTNALSSPIRYEVEDDQLMIKFPADFKGKRIQGEMMLYCPSDANKDLKTGFNITDSVFYFKVPTNNKGLHQLQLTWTVDTLKYYFEEKLFL